MSVSTVSLTDRATKAEIQRDLYNRFDWKGNKLPKSCNLDQSNLKLLQRGESHEDLASIFHKDEDATAYTDLIMSIAEQAPQYVEAQLFCFYRIEEILGIGLEISTESTAFGTHNAKYFFRSGSGSGSSGVRFEPFVIALESPNYDLQKSAAVSLATLLSIKPSGEEAMKRLVKWVCACLQDKNFANAIPALKLVVKDAMGRSLFLHNDGIKYILSLLEKEGISGNAQVIYELCFVLWACTLSTESVSQFFRSSGIVAALVNFLANSPSRKITRVVIAALNNLSSLKDAEILSQLLAANLERVLGNISGSAIAKHSSDPEFDADLAMLSENLSKNFRELSSFDRWVAEVNTETLRWGVTHTEKFWRENFKSIEQGDFENLKKIIALLSSKDPTIVCIALNDIGEIARFYPNGRLIVAKVGGKDAAMEKLGNGDANIERYALQCVSKLMVENWESLK